MTADSLALFWQFVTRLGEAQILLPAVLGMSFWLVWRGRALPVVPMWLGFIGAAALLTTITKVAFIGWGIGSAELDFTGISGHAMFATAIYPVVCRLALSRLGRGWQRAGWVAGLVLAALISYSRLPVQAHSASEALAGFLLGAAASVATVWFARPREVPMPVWLPALIVLWFAYTPMHAPPSFTHDIVTRLALKLSGRAVPFQRHDLHRDTQLQQVMLRAIERR